MRTAINSVIYFNGCTREAVTAVRSISSLLLEAVNYKKPAATGATSCNVFDLLQLVCNVVDCLARDQVLYAISISEQEAKDERENEDSK